MTTPECSDCEGGWRTVAEAYARQLADERAKPGTDAWDQMYASLLRSVYPCKTCQPTQFYRWAEGHWANDHDAAGCPDCSSGHRKPPTGRARRKTETEPLPAEPPPPAEPAPAPARQEQFVPDAPTRKDLE